MSGSVPTDHCSVDGCEKVVLAKGLCAMHDWRVRTHGEVGEVGRKRGEDGAGHVDRNGYISIQIDNRRVLQHRLVMEQLIGRPLEAHESVHHINGVRDDNRPENLELWSRSQPSGQRVADKVAWALDLLALYAPERLAT